MITHVTKNIFPASLGIDLGRPMLLAHPHPLPSIGAIESGHAALKLDGSDDYVDVGSGLNFSVSSKFTIIGLIRPDYGVTPQQSLIGRMQGITPYKGWEIYITTSVSGSTLGVYLIDTWSSKAAQVVGTTNLVSPQRWIWFAVTYSGNGYASGLKLYIDGAQETPSILTNTLSPSDNIQASVNCYLGRRQTITPYKGYYRDIKIFGEEMAADEIRFYHAYGSVWPKHINLLAWWNFQRVAPTFANGTRIPDRYGTNNGSMQNFTTNPWDALGKWWYSSW